MSIMGDFPVGLGALSTLVIVGWHCSAFSLLPRLFFISFNSFLMVSPCELHNVEDLGRGASSRVPLFSRRILRVSGRAVGEVASGD